MKNKMKPCKICGQPIAKNAKSCPSCGARNKKRHPLLLVIIIIAVIVILANALSQNNKPQPVRSTQTPQTTSSVPTETSPDITVFDETPRPETSSVAEADLSPEDVSVVPETSTAQETVNGIRSDFKEAMDSYEAFYTEYCAFLEDYSANPTDFTLLADYASLTAQAAEMDEAFDAWDEDNMSAEEMKYYLEVNNRIMQMLVDVSY